MYVGFIQNDFAVAGNTFSSLINQNRLYVSFVPITSNNFCSTIAEIVVFSRSISCVDHVLNWRAKVVQFQENTAWKKYCQ